MGSDPFDRWYDRDNWSKPLTDGPWEELTLLDPTPAVGPVVDDEAEEARHAEGPRGRQP